jgi:hypothetical protein
MSMFIAQRDLAFFYQGGHALVLDHQLTDVGVVHMITNLSVAIALAAMATLLYFRSIIPPRDKNQPDGSGNLRS